MWGIGKGGVLALGYFRDINLNITGFIDQKAQDGCTDYQGLPAYDITKVDITNSYIIIDLILPKEEIVKNYIN